MPIVPYYSMVGERAFREMRVVMVAAGQSLPPGDYGFLEHYCDEPHCDCRRVLLKVVRPDTGKAWATINFGWETADYYRKWSGDREMATYMADASLEPLGPQTKHSAELLKIFNRLLRPDAAYVARLKRHYAEVKRLSRKGKR